MLVLAMMLVIANCQCLLVCTSAPCHDIQSQDSSVPPCHQQSKQSDSGQSCSHPSLLAGHRLEAPPSLGLSSVAALVDLPAHFVLEDLQRPVLRPGMASPIPPGFAFSTILRV